MAPEGGEPTLLCTGRAHNRERGTRRVHTRAERRTQTRVRSPSLSLSLLLLLLCPALSRGA